MLRFDCGGHRRRIAGRQQAVAREDEVPVGGHRVDELQNSILIGLTLIAEDRRGNIDYGNRELLRPGRAVSANLVTGRTAENPV